MTELKEDDELGLTNPYSCVTCWILYLYSLEFGSPPLYAELNRVCRNMDLSELETLGPIAKALSPMPYGISVNDIKSEGEWTWDDGTPLNTESSPWNPGEPNNWGGHEHCATMNWGAGWNDIGCDFSTGFICERSSTL